MSDLVERAVALIIPAKTHRDLAAALKALEAGSPPEERFMFTGIWQLLIVILEGGGTDDAALTVSERLERPLKGAFNPVQGDIVRPHFRNKIEPDPELQAFIRARVMTQTFGQVAAAIATHFPPHRRVTLSSIHRWWHRRGKKTRPTIG